VGRRLLAEISEEKQMQVRRSFAVTGAAAVVVAVALLVGSSGALAGEASPRSGSLYVTKECTQYSGAAGAFCTITSSNIPWIRAGMEVVYANAFTSNGLDTDVVLSAGHGSVAYGHVILDATGSFGTVTFDGGTGAFRTFHGSADVAHVPGGPTGYDYTWIGTYSFG
jgi:hypothetical protein